MIYNESSDVSEIINLYSLKSLKLFHGYFYILGWFSTEFNLFLLLCGHFHGYDIFRSNLQINPRACVFFLKKDKF